MLKRTIKVLGFGIPVWLIGFLLSCGAALALLWFLIRPGLIGGRVVSGGLDFTVVETVVGVDGWQWDNAGAEIPIMELYYDITDASTVQSDRLCLGLSASENDAIDPDPDVDLSTLEFANLIFVTQVEEAGSELCTMATCGTYFGIPDVDLDGRLSFGDFILASDDDGVEPYVIANYPMCFSPPPMGGLEQIFMRWRYNSNLLPSPVDAMWDGITFDADFRLEID